MYRALVTTNLFLFLCALTPHAIAADQSPKPGLHRESAPVADNGQTPTADTICEPPMEGDSIAVTRAKYVCEIEEYLPVVQHALDETNTPEKEQAKILNDLRRSIGKKYKGLTPEWLLSFIYCRNQTKYNDPLGPTYEKLTESKNDAQIIKSSMTTGGKDMLLDNNLAKKVIQYMNDWGYGPTIQNAWSWLPGQSCKIN